MKPPEAKNPGTGNRVSFVWPGVIAAYADRLPAAAAKSAVTLLEGNTPLIRVPRVERWLHLEAELWLKLEGLNPTASFKDRGMTVALSLAKASGAQAVVCASTGNTSASAAAYAARAGMECLVVLPEAGIAKGKLAQALMYGARVIPVRSGFDEALTLAKGLASKGRAALVNSVNPDRIQGQKTAAFEIVEALGEAPELHVLPVGNAGNITAYWLGYQEAKQAGWSKILPRMAGFQAAGAAPLVRGHPVEHPETLATAIKIGNPASWKAAESARDQSGGLIGEVTDDEILEAYSALAREDGIFCEPASAAGVAGLRKLIKARSPQLKGLRRVVATLTGHGLKDPERALALSRIPDSFDPDLETLLRALDKKS